MCEVLVASEVMERLKVGSSTLGRWCNTRLRRSGKMVPQGGGTRLRSGTMATRSRKLISYCTQLAQKSGVATDPPVSFYSSLKNFVLDDCILATVKKHGWDSSACFFIQKGASAIDIQPSYKDYIDKAKTCIISLLNQSYLNDSDGIGT
jgi:hypothetical protein